MIAPFLPALVNIWLTAGDTHSVSAWRSARLHPPLPPAGTPDNKKIAGFERQRMNGLYLIGFAVAAFEAAACHVGETKDPNRSVPRGMVASAIMAGVYFVILPVV